jgi:hypothetical protein
VTPANRRLMWLAYALTIAAGIVSIVVYAGSKFVFAFFCLVVFSIAALAVRLPNHYAHLFLGIMWFTGFWVKYIFHQATGANYQEPHGLFDGSHASWDLVFLVIGVGGAGYLFGRLVALPVVRSATSALLDRPINVPRWWPSYRNLLWSAAGLVVLVVVAANQEFGFLVRGYVARFILPWPFGGLFAWLTDIGLALLLALFLAWDRRSGFGALRGFLALCIEGALFSVSTLSRGIYFFHTVPPLVTEGVKAFRERKRWSLVPLAAIWIVVGVGIPSGTTTLRLFGQNAVPTTQSQLQASRSAPIRRPIDADMGNFRLWWDHFVIMSQLLVIDRWTGLEGMMATVAYPDKGLSLLVEAAGTRRSYGTVEVYTRTISGSGFTEENAKTYHFASLAGPIAFFYFSGSLAVVFAGMAVVAVLMSAIELFWRWLVRDELLVAMSGLYLALIVMQFSGGVVQSAASLAAVTVAFLAVWCFCLFAGARETPKHEADRYNAGDQTYHPRRG